MVERVKAKKKKNPPAKKKFFYLLLAIFLLATLAATFFGEKGFLDIQKSKKRYLELQAEIHELTVQKQNLEAEIKELETNPMALEKEAREKLGLIKPEEKVVIRDKQE
ncbi:MAG: septum formation initiator family protein [Acidobacteriota bacterium]|nr:septum formation initiator family protein [Acidobacteriota bacterium]MDW3228874.1 septum formation initiator family protein [Acidobacteriota bacterium]MDY0231048.1 septum formation initiator family protein [Candidatus Saccharicenans sp.]